MTSATSPRKTAPISHPVFLAFALAVATLAVYYPVHRLPFINYDDNLYVTDNVHVQSGLQWDTVEWAFTTYDASNWHPLTWLSHALDVQLFGLSPAGPHIVNLLLHTLNVVLLFWVLWRATGFAGRSAMVAALFALHPINVQSVAWVAERKNLLSLTFFLLAVGAYRWYAQLRPRPSGRGREFGRIGRYLVVMLLFALGLMAKPQIITLPLVLLLWDYWPLGRMASSVEAPGFSLANPASHLQGALASDQKTFAWLVLEKLPLFALAAASALITLLAHRAGQAVHWLPLSLRAANAILSCARYVKRAVWPSHLALFYPYAVVHLTTWEVVASAIFLLGLTAFVFRYSPFAFRKTGTTEIANSGYLPVGWLWFLITLLPMLGLIQVGNQGMADRYAYLPFIGLFLMFVWGLSGWADRRRIPPKAQAAAGIAVLIALSAVTRRQIDYWQDSVTLWTHTLAVTHGNYIAEIDLGAALLKRGDVSGALQHFRAAAAIDPQDPLANMYLARYAHMQHDYPEAIAGYKKVIAVSLDRSLQGRAYRYMGEAYRSLGDEAQAQRSFRTAAELGY